jgi:hypothetical protein
MPEAFAQLPEVERVALTLTAKEKGVPLVERWRELELATSKAWFHRSRRAAKWLEDAGSVADLGCGHMLLESCLRADQAYIPVDFLARDERTVVVDFNRPPIPELGATHFAALGLFEYLYDLDGFLRSLRAGFKAGVASFYTRRPDVPQARRLSNGWVNHHTDGEFRALLGDAGFTISRVFEFQPAHFLFRLD